MNFRLSNFHTAILLAVLLWLSVVFGETKRLDGEMRYCQRLSHGQEWSIITKGLLNEGACVINGQKYPMPKELP